jgi:hypothetical protein
MAATTVVRAGAGFGRSMLETAIRAYPNLGLDFVAAAFRHICLSSFLPLHALLKFFSAKREQRFGVVLACGAGKSFNCLLVRVSSASGTEAVHLIAQLPLKAGIPKAGNLEIDLAVVKVLRDSHVVILRAEGLRRL